MWRFRELLPFYRRQSDIVAYPEGNTPLLDAPRCAEYAGVRRIRFKHLGFNPTGSFKDYGMAAGVTQARILGMRAVACASTGNTSASMAAYAARAGITAIVLVPEHGVSFAKLSQSLDYGGMVVLRHETPAGDPFWTLYGHLARAGVAALSPGQCLTRGTCFAQLGTPDENGGWDPHLHFQLALRTDGMSGDWLGVADPDDRAFWMAICPNPAALLNLPDARVAYQPIDEARVRADRRAASTGSVPARAGPSWSGTRR